LQDGGVLGRARRGDHDGYYPLSPFRVGKSDDRCLAHGRMLKEHVFDLAR
jgi:hypothetical protein